MEQTTSAVPWPQIPSQRAYEEVYHSEVADEEGSWVIRRWVMPGLALQPGQWGYKGEADERWLAVKYQYLDRVEITSASRCVEMACGDGKIIIPLALRHPEAEMWALDYSPAAVAHAERYYGLAQANGLHIAPVHFSCQDATDTSFPDEMFDRVLIFGLLEHLPEAQYYQVLWEAKRILRTDGIVYLHGPWHEIEGGGSRVSTDLQHLRVRAAFL